MDLNSCRICLSPSFKFISIFGEFHGRLIKEIIEDLASIVIKGNAQLPKYICEPCLTSLLHAESIITACRKNNEFLNELANIEDVKNETQIVEDVMIADLINEEKSETILDIPVITFTEIPLDEEGQKVNKFEIPWETFENINEEFEIKQKLNKRTKFVCSFCGKEYVTRQKLIYHEKSTHSKLKSNLPIKPYKCDRCGMSFKQKSHIINHLKNVHLKIKRYQCNICGFPMYSKTHYTNHLKTHSDIKEFTCERCNKSFTRKETLMVHLKTHDGLRPYVCKFCGKSYTAHTDLKRHISKHTNTKPYICQLCESGFVLKRQLLEHVEQNHQGIDTSSWLTGKTSWSNLMN